MVISHLSMPSEDVIRYSSKEELILLFLSAGRSLPVSVETSGLSIRIYIRLMHHIKPIP